MNARAVPLSSADEEQETANDRFKRTSENLLWSSLIGATLAHFAVFVWWPAMTVADVSFTARELEAITLPPEIDIPKPPEQIARPATPVISETLIDEDITIAPTTFLDNPVESLPPPRPSGDRADTRDLSEAPAFTPYTVAPVLLNRAAVMRALEAGYPKVLREASLGGTVDVHVFVDAGGRVQNAVVDRSSGYPEFDRVALELAFTMEFSPAQNRDRNVPVWISIPVIFSVR